jgi:outer membrane protein OmpA-like peptidoglycan-associated protein
MNMQHFLATCILCCLTSTVSFAQEDMAGSSDHPQVPRISGSVLIAHSITDFTEGEFLALDENDDPKRQYVEGQSTRLVYLTPAGTTPVSALRNYQEAFSALGEITEIYTCRRGDCARNTGKDFIWKDSARFANNSDDLGMIYSSHLFHTNQVYWYGKITSDAGSYDVSFYASERADHSLSRTDIEAGRILVHIQIIGDDSFEAELEFVEASAIASAIADDGHIALYGLFFNTGEDQLTAESTPTLAEIAKVLEGSPDLGVYVVGHTDSVGSVESNFDLSRRRAASVVQSLQQDYGIDSNRLVALGAGLTAPVATNQSDAGRALNRRVELVQR